MVESDRDTTFYNGNSRACMTPTDAQDYRDGVTMNKKGLKESKVYDPDFYNLGINASKTARGLFKRFAGSETTRMTSKADNRHVSAEIEKRPGPDQGRIIGYTTNLHSPGVKHVSQLEINLWKGLNTARQGGDGAAWKSSLSEYVELTQSEKTGEARKEALDLLTSRVESMKGKESFPDLKDLLGVLKGKGEEPNLRASMRITLSGKKKKSSKEKKGI